MSHLDEQQRGLLFRWTALVASVVGIGFGIALLVTAKLGTAPADVVATGTNHRGLNPFMDGDTIELETEKLGRLTFKVRDDLKRTWARVTRLQHHDAGGEGAHTPQTGGKYSPAKK